MVCLEVVDFESLGTLAVYLLSLVGGSSMLVSERTSRRKVVDSPQFQALLAGWRVRQIASGMLRRTERRQVDFLACPRVGYNCSAEDH